ncbi:LAMI_0F03752g1_1 [Lachancea mirantina]|uniref:LAMI_0F03752g1_1 n=1 Tax=Lachancea mirantina TaxID=1230905 RepID=A0A1G4JXB4_9SACH|nr:LAMI_0F03752g1_1 [Lachancea mirantina]
MAGNLGNYSRVNNNDGSDSGEENRVDENALETDDLAPLQPPSYEDLEENLENGSRTMETMEIEEEVVYMNKLQRLKHRFENYIVIPVRERISDPLVQLLSILSNRVDFYLSKVGNPLILRRFVYILCMSLVMFYFSSNGLPGTGDSGFKGMFSDKRSFVNYARRTIDLSKMETDLEYLSSMPHMAGSKGDFAIATYVGESFSNNRLQLVLDAGFDTFINYYGKLNLNARTKSGEILQLETNQNNFSPLSPNGTISNSNLIYAHLGREADYKLLESAGLSFENCVVMLHFDAESVDQILRAQKMGFQAVLFVSEKSDNNDSIQQRSSAILQYSVGDPLTPGWSSVLPKKIDANASPIRPKIPVVPLSLNQALSLTQKLSTENAVEFENGWVSGVSGDITLNLDQETIEHASQPNWNIVGKIEGKEQNDKAIIVSAARDSLCYGSLYPNVGTTALLSLVQLLQQVKYEFNWRPLRNIYFMSYDASQYGHSGATEIVEAELGKIKNEIYSVVDISQVGVSPDGPKLDIQTHPLLAQFFNEMNSLHEIDALVRGVQQHGDWSAYLANGIPTTIIGASHVINRAYPIDTCDDTYDRLKSTSGDRFWEDMSEIVAYLFQVILELADNPLIPFDVEDYAKKIDVLLEDLKASSVESLNYQGIADGINLWKHIGEQWSSFKHMWTNIVMVEDDGLEPSLLSVHRWTWNKKLTNIARRQCDAAGVPNREFYKNVLFGPSLWIQQSHDSWSFPGVRDAIQDSNWQGAQEEINKVADVLRSSAELFIEETTNS